MIGHDISVSRRRFSEGFFSGQDAGDVALARSLDMLDAAPTIAALAEAKPSTS